MSGFLARWSRLKEDSRQAPAADAPPRQVPQPALSEADIAALPPIDALTADSDVSVFLRHGVPDSLRKAALRRAWMVDPAIRDFVGHARDYDYDWNMPGGAPGCGPLQAADDVVAMVRRIVGDPAGPAAAEAPVEIAAVDAAGKPHGHG